MTAVKHLISLSTEDGSEKIWKDLFEGKEDFSGWIKSKLMEEKEKRLDKDYIYKKLSELENDSAYWKKQLDKANEIQTAKAQTSCKEQPKTREEMERDFDILIKSIGMALEFRFDCDYPDHQVLEDLALEWNELPPSYRTSIDDFLESKGYTKKIMLQREATI